MDALRHDLVDLAHRASARGWTAATSGNFSAVAARDPLRLLITPSGADKGSVAPADLIEVDADGRVCGEARGTPSAETALHLAVIRATGAGSVAHTHSLWSALLSDSHAVAGGLMIHGFEMLKALSGVATHTHREWLPIVPNAQDWTAAAPGVERVLRARPDVHGVLSHRHGLYTWGRSVAEAGRHLEGLEFLLEALGRMEGGTWPR